VQILIAKGTRLLCELKPNIVKVDNGARIPTRTIIITTGAEYRRLPLKNLSRFEGLGIYYATTLVDAQSCDGREAIVVGGGNSAGHAALFLTEGKARSHAEKVRWFDQEYVSLFDSPNQRALYDCTLAKHQDLDIGRILTS
jgi:lysine/ornithine N-monooxygenase